MKMILAPFHPLSGTLDRSRSIFLFTRIRRTFIERHHHIRTQDRLNVHHALRCQEMFVPVNVRPEFDAVISELAPICKAEDLIPAAIGQDRFLPAHEIVQAAGCPDDLKAGTKEQMISVGQFNLCTNGVKVFLGECLNGRARSYRHKER
jgi:hypothetical protein